MKILHIVSTYLPAYRYGGPILSVHTLNKWLIKGGADITVYTTNIDLEGKVKTNEEVMIDGVKVWYFPVTWEGWQYSRELHQKLQGTIKDFDLVHITSTFLAASTLGARYAKKFNKPYIISPRGNLMKEPLKHNYLKKFLYLLFVEKRNLQNAAAIHFTTDMEKEEYVLQKLPFKRAVVIANPFESKDFEHNHVKGYLHDKFGIKQSEKIVLFLGRLSWKKGFDTLIPAFARVLKGVPEARLVIVGPDDEGYKEKIRQMMIENGLEEKKHVFFHSEVFGDDKLAVYEDHDVSVLTSYSENFGMAVVEAMHGTSHGTAMVMTEGVALGDLVRQRKAGVVVQKKVESVADAIAKLLKEPERAKEYGERGHKLVEDCFGPDVIANDFLKVYNELVV